MTVITAEFNGFPASKFPAIQISYRLDPWETVNFVSFESGNKINGFPWDQSFNKCLMFSTTQPYSSLVFIETFVTFFGKTYTNDISLSLEN